MEHFKRTPAKRYLHEVVMLTRDCELGQKGERAVVISLAGDQHGAKWMTLLFFSRPPAERRVNTGADYAFLTEVTS